MTGRPSEIPAALSAPAEHYLRFLQLERGLAQNTITSYRRDLGRYLGYLATTGITSYAQVTPVVVADFAVVLRAPQPSADPEQPPQPPLSTRTAARMITAVRGFHRHLLTEGITETNPSDRVKPPKLPERLPKALTADEMRRLLETPDTSTPAGLRDRALLEFLYGTGTRISEAVGLDVDDLTALEEQKAPAGASIAVVRVRGKGNKERIVPMGSYARSAVDDYLTRARPGLVARAKAGTRAGALFLNLRGSRLSRQSAWTIIQSAAEKAGITSEVSPHTLRHSYATHLVEGGADIRTVQELMGHASILSTQIYTKVTVDTLREVYASTHPRAFAGPR